MSNSPNHTLFLMPLAFALLFVGLGERPAYGVTAIEYGLLAAALQPVRINGERALFEAKIGFCSEGPAQGKIELLFADGYVVQFEAIHAKVLKDRIVLVLRDAVDPAVGELFTAQVIDDEESPGTDLWDSGGSSFEGGPAMFDAVTHITRVPAGSCEPVDIGQVPFAFEIVVKPQEVHSKYSPNLAAVRAKISVSSNNSADGVIDLRFHDGSKRVYDGVFSSLYGFNDQILAPDRRHPARYRRSHAGHGPVALRNQTRPTSLANHEGPGSAHVRGENRNPVGPVKILSLGVLTYPLHPNLKRQATNSCHCSHALPAR